MVFIHNKQTKLESLILSLAEFYKAYPIAGGISEDDNDNNSDDEMYESDSKQPMTNLSNNNHNSLGVYFKSKRTTESKTKNRKTVGGGTGKTSPQKQTLSEMQALETYVTAQVQKQLGQQMLERQKQKEKDKTEREREKVTQQQEMEN